MTKTWMTSASEWWQSRFGTRESVSLQSLTNALWDPCLVGSSCSVSPASAVGDHELGVNKAELQVLLKFCFGLDAAAAAEDNQVSIQPPSQNTSEISHLLCVSQQEFTFFVARFGPIDLCLTKCVKCFYHNGKLSSWFHGDMSRFHAEQMLSGQRDGTFLIRFSESHPTKFTLSYVKVMPNGKRAIKNCLIENLGETLTEKKIGVFSVDGTQRGYGLMDSSNHAFSSIASFIQRSASRLKHPLPCKRAEVCNLELATIKTQEAVQADDAYRSFSGDSTANTFADNNPPNEPFRMESNSYSSFSAQSVTPPRTPPPERRPQGFSSNQPVAADLSTSSNTCHRPVELDYACFNTSLRARTARLNGHEMSKLPSHTQQHSSRSKLSDDPPTSPLLKHPSSIDAQQTLLGVSPPSDSYGSFAFHSVSSSSNSTEFPKTMSSEYGSFVVDSIGTDDSKTPNSQPAAPTSTSEDLSDYGNFPSLSTSSSQDMTFAPPKIPIQLPPALSVPSVSTASSGDGYGNFATLSVSSDHLRQAPVIPASSLSTFSSASSTGDGYGNFANLSFSSDNTTPIPAAALQTFSSSSTGDEYGNFASMELFSNEPSTLASLPASVLPSYASGASSMGGALPRFSSAASSSGDGYGNFASLEIASSSGTKPQQSDHSAPSETHGDSAAKETQQRPLSAPIPPFISMPVASSSLSAPHPPSTPVAQPAPTPASKGAESVLSDDNPPEPVDALLELNSGMNCYKNHQLDEAICHFQLAKDLAVAKQDQVVEARALGNLGTVYLDKKLACQAVECYTKCLEITRTINDAKRERTILNNLILALNANEQYEEALAYCQIQLQMSQSEVNRRKITTRMSLLREKAKRKHNQLR